jgi:hypothetical protein
MTRTTHSPTPEFVTELKSPSPHNRSNPWSAFFGSTVVRSSMGGSIELLDLSKNPPIHQFIRRKGRWISSVILIPEHGLLVEVSSEGHLMVNPPSETKAPIAETKLKNRGYKQTLHIVQHPVNKEEVYLLVANHTYNLNNIDLELFLFNKKESRLTLLNHASVTGRSVHYEVGLINNFLIITKENVNPWSDRPMNEILFYPLCGTVPSNREDKLLGVLETGLYASVFPFPPDQKKFLTYNLSDHQLKLFQISQEEPLLVEEIKPLHPLPKIAFPGAFIKVLPTGEFIYWRKQEEKDYLFCFNWVTGEETLIANLLPSQIPYLDNSILTPFHIGICDFNDEKKTFIYNFYPLPGLSLEEKQQLKREMGDALPPVLQAMVLEQVRGDIIKVNPAIPNFDRKNFIIIAGLALLAAIAGPGIALLYGVKTIIDLLLISVLSATAITILNWTIRKIMPPIHQNKAVHTPSFTSYASSHSNTQSHTLIKKAGITPHPTSTVTTPPPPITSAPLPLPAQPNTSESKESHTHVSKNKLSP